MKEKVLVLGGTGAFGVYLVPELLRMGYQVDVVSLDDRSSDNPNLVYMKGDANDDEYLTELLKNKYDAIVDYMIYVTEKFRSRYMLLLNSTKHYIFLSSYRIYAETVPITETSPRLLDVCTDRAFLATEDYALYKAKEENLLVQSGKRNWTILRPSITYSKRRFQLVTLEADIVIYRMRAGKTVVLPEEAMNIEGTMSWSGDSAKMVSRLILNPQAYGERYTISTSEHHTWREIAEYYHDLGGLNYITVDTDTYLNIISENNIFSRQQLMYDRLLNRVVDNRKILQISGLQQSDLILLKEGLRRELAALPEELPWKGSPANDRMDAYLASKHL